MNPRPDPPAILNQPIDYSRDPFIQARERWKALYAHYGVHPDCEQQRGVDGWRDKLICALARDCWPGFRLSRQARGKPRQISDPFVLLDVVSAVLEIEPTWPVFKKDMTQEESETLKTLISALRAKAMGKERKPSIAWLAKELRSHPKSPWKGKRAETLRSNIVKTMQVRRHWNGNVPPTDQAWLFFLGSTLGPSERGPTSFGLPPAYSDFFEEGTD
jgi:hypothetical protein